MIEKTVEKRASDLLKKKNVNGVAVGEKWIDGKSTGQPALVVLVEKKEALNVLSSSDIIPQTVDGIPTDVMGRVGKIKAQSFKSRERPLPAGVSCGHLWVTAGTLGGYFLDKNGKLVALSNNHVLAAENKGIRIGENGKAGHVILQPGIYDGGKYPRDVVGQLLDYVALKRSGNVEDSAIVLMNSKYANPTQILEQIKVVGQIKGFNENLKIGDKVQKSGRTTGHTVGKVTGLNAVVSVLYDMGVIEFKDQYLFSNMSAGGDSGSIICDTDGNAASLLFAGSDTVTVGNNIKYPRQTYGLNVINAGPSLSLKQSVSVIILEDGVEVSHQFDTIAEIEEAIVFAQNLAKKNGGFIEVKMNFNAKYE